MRFSIDSNEPIPSVADIKKQNPEISEDEAILRKYNSAFDYIQQVPQIDDESKNILKSLATQSIVLPLTYSFTGSFITKYQEQYGASDIGLQVNDQEWSFN